MRSSQPANEDGKQVEVFANIDGLKDAEQVEPWAGKALACCARSFFHGPRERAERRGTGASYTAIVTVGPERPVVIRTLDVGGDKPLAYLPIQREDNPFFGERGIRVGLDQPEVLRTQLRAFLRASSAGQGDGDVPDDRDNPGAARCEGDARRGSRMRLGLPRFIAASWWKCRAVAM